MDTRYTLSEFAEIMRKNKWYLLETEESLRRALRLGYGTVTIRYELRANEVEKLSVVSTEESILRPKDGHPIQQWEKLTIDILKSSIQSE